MTTLWFSLIRLFALVFPAAHYHSGSLPLARWINRNYQKLSVNMPQGAHHSDLSHQPAAPTDTADVTAARKKVADILGGWLREIDGSSP